MSLEKYITLIKKYIHIFLVSSSLPAFSITLAYVGHAFSRSGRPSTIPYEAFPLAIPFMYGIFGIIDYYVVNAYGVNYSLFVGATLGSIFSLIGRFYLNLPTTIFEFNKTNEYKVHVIAMLLYGTIFRVIITPILNNFII